MDKKEIKDQLIEIHTQEAKRHVQKIKQSFRWKAGNAFARLIEFFLFRKKEKLSIDFLEEHLQTIEQLTLQTNKTIPGSLRSFSFLGRHSLPNSQPQKIIFLVSDTHIETSVFGDTHVAHDLKLALEENYPNLTCHLANYQSEVDFDVDDIVINMLWDTNLVKPNEQSKPFKIAWIRNYPDRWVANPSFLHYDLFLCSSYKIQNYIKQHTQQPVYLFPIAANVNRFQPNECESESESESESECSKIVFVGNKWKESRHIERFIQNSDSLKELIEVYGKGWDKQIAGDMAKGAVSNLKLPKLYKQAHIILDAANETTKRWASLNSRVFNAIASHKIVLTDSVEATQLFKSPVPVYQNVEELTQKIQDFKVNAESYKAISQQLYQELISHHTYNHRAQSLQLILSPKLKIALKIAPKSIQQKHFGDLYFAKALAKALKKYGHEVEIHVYEDWYKPNAQQTDLVIVLRGLRAYQPLEKQSSFLWLISHPEMVSLQEIKQYAHCFLASDYHYKKLSAQQMTNLSVMHQCADTEVFVKKASYKKNKKLLFVGNSRNVFRKSVQYALNCGYDIDVYGMGWKQFIPVKYIKADFVANDQLFELYNQYDIVLNDHWEDMLTHGYASNRLFDAAACGAQIVSDCPKETENLLPGIHYYTDLASFKNQIESIRNKDIAHNFSPYFTVCNQHTFNKRAETILHKYYYLKYKKQ